MRWIRPALVFAVTGAGVLLVQPPSYAWWIGGHKLCTEAAVKSLPEDMPEFFRKASLELAEMSAEPDNWKSQTTPRLRASEAPEHFIDLEFLDGAKLPKDRPEYVKLMAEKKIDPYKAGFLPYALQEGTERLTLAFREYRDRMDKKLDTNSVQQRAIMYAGWLAHYCQDAGMPLHTTKNYDGRPQGEEKLAQKGIHARIDAYPEKHGLTVELLKENLAAEDLVDTWPAIVKFIETSHTKVDKCYELDKQGAFDTAPEKGRELMLECARASAKLTLDLWYSAWKNSDPKRATIR
ncbi:MAG TPA: hypothetical protein VEJ63_19560 [Planctomycetota bacterium]|nr:hypothetical protein [Planctomycetota bacterium]